MWGQPINLESSDSLYALILNCYGFNISGRSCDALLLSLAARISSVLLGISELSEVNNFLHLFHFLYPYHLCQIVRCLNCFSVLQDASPTPDPTSLFWIINNLDRPLCPGPNGSAVPYNLAPSDFLEHLLNTPNDGCSALASSTIRTRFKYVS